MRRDVVVAVAVAAASALVVAPAPSYDPWMWLVWGREVSAGTLSTSAGPAFKPLPVAVCAVLSAFGSAAPVLWVLIARAGALLAVILAFRSARRLAGAGASDSLAADASRALTAGAAGWLAAIGVTFTGGLAVSAAAGMAEGLLLALALSTVELWRRGHRRAAVVCAVACGLLRVESWPFLIVGAALRWRAHPRRRAALLAISALIPLAWFAPELVGSGELLRSSDRARIPNPGQPALADSPALASLRAAVDLVAWPLWLGLAALVVSVARGLDRGVRAALAPAAVGSSWIALVAVMAEAGFSGEPRYAAPGAALIAVSGAIGLARLVVSLVSLTHRSSSAATLTHRSSSAATLAAPSAGVTPLARAASAATLTALLAAAMVAPRVDELARLPAASDHQRRLSADLDSAIVALGGREPILACGTPYVGRLRSPLLAYHLRVPKHVIEPDAPPRAPGVVFSSRLMVHSPPAPSAPSGFALAVRRGTWTARTDCE